MLSPGTVTSFAGYTHHQVRLSVSTGGIRICHWFGIRSVALETTRQHGTAEVYDPVAIAGAVHPASDLGPIRHWELKQPIGFASISSSSPIKIGLALSSRADDEIETL